MRRAATLTLAFLFLGAAVGHSWALDARFFGALLRITEQALSLNDKIGTLDETGRVPEETLTFLDEQYRTLQSVTIPRHTFSEQAYALSVGALVGVGEGVAGEIRGVIDYGKQQVNVLEEARKLDRS